MPALIWSLAPLSHGDLQSDFQGVRYRAAVFYPSAVDRGCWMAFADDAFLGRFPYCSAGKASALGACENHASGLGPVTAGER